MKLQYADLASAGETGRRCSRAALAKLLVVFALASSTLVALADPWAAARRGSWHETGPIQPSDFLLAPATGDSATIVVQPSEPSCVQQAVHFLVQDVQRLTGRKLKVAAQGIGRVIEIRTRANDPRWEAHSVTIDADHVLIEGSNPRGTAFGIYELSERMGIDPLYHYTGYTPKQSVPFALKPVKYEQGPPTFRYRGFFHDDEDILPRPFDARNGTPYVRGTVPREWYEKYFETALRLKMNQVAPYVRTMRHFEIQKMASDWGLFYTSHHYDILLSNPYGFDRFGLAKSRNAGAKYDWFTNSDGLLKFWKAGAEENKNLDAIYPVGLRNTEDASYSWPPNISLAEKSQIYATAIKQQTDIVRSVLPAGKIPLFHLTLYGEMLDAYRQGNFDVPSDVILVWDDNGDGIIRGLPESLGKWKHGIYYHLAYYGGKVTKQSVHTVQPSRIEEQFRKIVQAGATEYCLVNVSELREHVMEGRFLADIFWNAQDAFSKPNSAGRFVDWWSREYFPESATDAAKGYAGYYDTIRSSTDIYFSSVKIRDWLNELMKKLNGEECVLPSAAEIQELRERVAGYERALASADRATSSMSPMEGQFYFEHCRLGMLLDYRPSQAALVLARAFDAPDSVAARRICAEALKPLETLESEIKHAERPPFENWYRPTWIRYPDFMSGGSDFNVHRPYEMMRRFIDGLK